MREQLGMVVGAAETLDPAGGSRVPLAAHRARDLAVRDVTHENVSKCVLVLAGDGGAPLAADQALPLEGVQATLDGFEIEPRQLGRRAGPEDFSEYGGVLHQTLFIVAQAVEARRDDSLDRLGQLVRRSTLDVEARELLGVERIAAGAFEQLALRVDRQDGLLEDV